MPAPALLRPATRAIVVLTAALIAFSNVGAEPYPKASPIRLIVPQQVGSSSDLVSRVMAQKLSEALGQQIVVDNRPGAGGTIAMETGSRATPDGYTLIAAATGPVAIAPHAYRKLDYRPIADFTAVSLFATTQNMLVVNGKLGIQSVRDLIERARERPGQLNLASGGSGTQSHLAGVLFAEAANVQIVHVPYRGAGSSVAAIISGEAQLMLVTGEERLSAIPELPTMQEAGLPDYVSTGWVGLMAPRGVPKGVIDTLSRALTEAAKDPRTIAALDRLGAQASTSSSDRFASTMRSEFAKYGNAVKAAGLSIE